MVVLMRKISDCLKKLADEILEAELSASSTLEAVAAT